MWTRSLWPVIQADHSDGAEYMDSFFHPPLRSETDDRHGGGAPAGHHFASSQPRTGSSPRLWGVTFCRPGVFYGTPGIPPIR